MAKNINQIIKEKLNTRLKYRPIKNILKKIHLTLRNFLLIVVPMLALFFTTILAWQVNDFRYSDIKIANANNSSVLGANTKNNSDSKTSSTQTGVSNTIEKSLEIPLIKQIYPLSCEAASLQMALKYYKIDVDQDTLLNKIGFSKPQQLTEKDGQFYWGDPNLGFVGDPKGWFYNTKNGETSLKYATGWGVNNGPVLKAAKLYRPNSYLVDNGKVEQIKSALDKNNPVIWWHVRDDAHEEKIQITTPLGQKIDYGQMHVAVIVGYYEKDGSTIYKINDPYFSEYEINEQDLSRLWARNNNQLVVVM